MFTNPLSHAGYPPGVTGTPTTQPTEVRAATAAEVAAGVLDNCYVSPKTLGTGGGPGVFTTLTSSGNTSLGTGASSVINVGIASSTIGFFGATAAAKTGSTNDLKASLVTYGLITGSGATPLNLGGGLLTSGALTAVGTVNLNSTGTAVTNIGNTTGNTVVTGSLTASTSLTASAGNITATNGNIVKGTAGNKDIYTSVASTTTAGDNSAGKVTLVGGTATIATTAITASSIVRLTRQGVGATSTNPLGHLSVGTISAGVSFIINAWSATDATALATTDVSSIGWEIVN